jgi:hypothetical protein
MAFMVVASYSMLSSSLLLLSLQNKKIDGAAAQELCCCFTRSLLAVNHVKIGHCDLR